MSIIISGDVFVFGHKQKIGNMALCFSHGCNYGNGFNYPFFNRIQSGISMENTGLDAEYSESWLLHDNGHELPNISIFNSYFMCVLLFKYA